MTLSLGNLPLRRLVRLRCTEWRRDIAETARVLARVGRLAWRAAPGPICLLALTHLSLAIVPVAQVWIYKRLVDGIALVGTGAFQSTRAAAREIGSAGALYLVTLFFSQAAAGLLGPLAERLNERLTGSMRLTLLEVGERQPGLAFYDDEAVQNDLETLRRDLDEALEITVLVLPQYLQQLTLVGGLALVLARLHPLLPLLVIGSAAPRFRYEWRLGHDIWNGMMARSADWRWMNYCVGILSDAGFAKEVRLYGLGDFFLNLYRQTFERTHQELVQLRRREVRGTTLYALINAGVTGGAYVAIVVAAARRQLTLGDVALYTSATFQLGGALTYLARFYGAFAGRRLMLRKFFDLLGRPSTLASAPNHPRGTSEEPETIESEPERPDAPRQNRKPGARSMPEIEFRDVWFTYPKSTQPALRGISLRIAPGEKIAVVGENGAGKTTLVNLLTRLYDPTDGEIRANGALLPALDVHQWRRQLANVSQDFLRLDALLHTNLALANLACEIDDTALRSVCAQVGLTDLVRTLPEGLEQMLGRRFQGGVELSGGEWQKVAIARALLREEAKVLIFDEPTSALDAPTEHAIFQQFLQLAERRTTILISHRFSTVRMADRILVMDAGRIVEEGSHRTLMAKGGMYAELFSLHAARYH